MIANSMLPITSGSCVVFPATRTVNNTRGLRRRRLRVEPASRHTPPRPQRAPAPPRARHGASCRERGCRRSPLTNRWLPAATARGGVRRHRRATERGRRRQSSLRASRRSHATDVVPTLAESAGGTAHVRLLVVVGVHGAGTLTLPVPWSEEMNEPPSTHVAFVASRHCALSRAVALGRRRGPSGLRRAPDQLGR